MLVLALSLVALALLALLYRSLPNRRIFAWFCLSLALVGAMVWFASQPGRNEPTMTLEEKRALQQQQQIFMEWYASYQKDIDQLDRNWQWYHSILENFKDGSIDLQTVYVRLTQLEEDSRLLRDRIRGLAPPDALDDARYQLLQTVLAKTLAYVEAQHRTITLTRAASDPTHLLSDDPAEQSRALQDIMIRESPPGLFTASEIAKLRESFAIPEEGTGDGRRS